MRILVVQESDWLEKGPHQSHHLMERLSEMGHEIRVIDFEISWRGNQRSGIVSRRTIYREVRKATNTGKVTVIRPAFLRIPIIDYISLIFTHRREIDKQMRDFLPDVIIAFGIMNASIALRLADREELPFIYYIIDELHRLVPNRHLQGIARIIESHNMTKSDAVVTIGEGLKEYALAMGASPQKTETVTAGIDLAKFQKDESRDNIRRRLGIGDSEIVLFFMGWLYEFSGLREVATELARTPTDRYTVKLLIMGRGELKATLTSMSNEPCMRNRIILLDWQPYDKIHEYLSAADICILPAYDNAIMRNIVPIKVYEYMASGKPVISTELHGMLKEFGVGNGVTYVKKPEDVIKMAVEMAESGKAREDGTKARAHMQKYDWKGITCEFQRLIEKTIELKREDTKCHTRDQK